MVAAARPALAALALLALAGCAAPDGPTTAAPPTREAVVLAPADLSGTASDLGLEAHEAPQDDVGLARLCAGEADVVVAGRTATAAERERCASVGLDVVELQVAAGADVLAVGPLTDTPDCLGLAQARAVLAGDATRWSQLDAGLADAPLATTGTRTALTGPADDVAAARRLPALETELGDLEAQVRAGWDAWAAADRTTRPAVREQVDALRTRRNQVEADLADAGAARDRLAPTLGRLGVLGPADLDPPTSRPPDGVRLLAVDGGAGCVAPDEASVTDGRYPLTRPVLLVTTTRALGRPAVRGRLLDAVRRVPSAAAAHDLLPAPADRLAAALDVLDAATPAEPPPVERPVW
ncbi:hypothetical protein GCM10023340_12520 [Nocardioides marinquilinus]|uniref:PBP domain-containing protein n=1 Tax=Nocardioides marinquilinus TaxID=1210400 RepID=A0ABP9PHY7_9ACTN